MMPPSPSSPRRSSSLCPSATTIGVLLLVVMATMMLPAAAQSTPSPTNASTPTPTTTTFLLTSITRSTSSAYKIRSVATPDPNLGYSSSRVYFASLKPVNSSITFYDTTTRQFTNVMFNSGFSSCSPWNDVAVPSSTYPVTPNGVGLSPNGDALYIADRTPSSRVFQVSSLGSGDVSKMVYSRILGGNCSFSTKALPDGSPAITAMKASRFVVQDSVTGTIYFTQSYSVFSLSTSGVVNYYFGNETSPGNRSAEPYLAIHRLDARTDTPAQIVIDAVGNTMFIAEQGMATVRQIDMKTGVAEVTIGYFLSYTFPPDDCLKGRCKVSNVTFISPQALALYRPVSVAQRWLFIGDFTGAVIYRLIMETGEVTVVAGLLLMSGYADGLPGTSQLFGIQSFALGPSVLYIADNQLRRLELNDHGTPAPPLVSERVVTVTTTTVIVSTLLVGLVNPTAVTQASRANVILNMFRCQKEFGDLPVFTHPLRFAIGDDPDFEYYVGAIIGNVALCVGIVVLNAVVVFVYAYGIGKKKSLGQAASKLKFPSLVALPMLFVLEPTTSVGISLFLYAGISWEVAVGVIGFVASCLAFSALCVYFVFFFEGHKDFEMLDKKYSGLIARMVNPVGEWLQTELTGQMGMFFEDYLPKCWWFVVFELGMCVLSGVLEGIKPEEQSRCLTLVGLCTALFTIFFLSILYYQPYTVRFTFYIRLTIAGMQMVSTFLSVAYVKTEDPKWEAAATSLALGSLYVTTVDAVFSLLIAIRDVVEFMQHHSTQVVGLDTEARLNIMSRSSSESGDSIVMQTRERLIMPGGVEEEEPEDDTSSESKSANKPSRLMLNDELDRLGADEDPLSLLGLPDASKAKTGKTSPKFSSQGDDAPLLQREGSHSSTTPKMKPAAPALPALTNSFSGNMLANSFGAPPPPPPPEDDGEEEGSEETDASSDINDVLL